MRSGRLGRERGKAATSAVAAVVGIGVSVAIATFAAPRVARAQAAPELPATPALPGTPEVSSAPETPAPAAPSEAPVAPAPRPRFSAAIGFGWSFDSAGFSPAKTQDVPSMFATGGVGADWPVGVELVAFASSAVGRYRVTDAVDAKAPVDRLALDATAVLRPLAWSFTVADERYGARLLRAFGVELGLGLERDSTTMSAGSRFGLHLGARVEVPLTPPGGSELHLRFAVRRFEGLYTPVVGDVDVGDTVEIFAALVTIF